ncbi:MAG: energy transducer TonB [Sphingobium sp.]
MGRGASPFRIGGPVAASLLVNALLIAALFSLGLSRDSRRAVAPSLTVMSLAVLKGVEDGEDEAEAATPSPPMVAAASSAEAMPDEPRLPATQPMVSEVAVLSILSQPMPVQVALPSASGPATAPPTATARKNASGAAPPTSRGATYGLEAYAPPGASRSYAAKVRSWLYAHKTYPRRARMQREEGSVQVRFVIDRAGVLIEGVIVRGSGNGALDDEASAMMHRASPFPKAPNDVPGNRIEFIAPIDFVLPV